MRMNQWDALSQYFDTHKHTAEINPGAADNILIAWPSVLSGIAQVQQDSAIFTALDYGCGGGSFAAELQRRGYLVVGCDSSQGMIAMAKKNLGDAIPFYVCDAAEVSKLKESPFDLITAIMVFQFVEDIETCIRHLDVVLKSGGVLAFAIFNPDYVEPNHGDGKLFRFFKAPDQPTKGFMVPTDDTKIQVFIRTEEEYDNIFRPLGYHRIYVDKPSFTREFLEKYPTDADTTMPEYLVLVYKKPEE